MNIRKRAARAAGSGVSIVTLERIGRVDLLDAVNTLADQGVDGVIVIAPLRATVSALHDLPARLPVVAVEAGPETGLPSASVDQYEGAQLPCGTCSTSATKPSGTSVVPSAGSKPEIARKAGATPSPTPIGRSRR